MLRTVVMALDSRGLVGQFLLSYNASQSKVVASSNRRIFIPGFAKNIVEGIVADPAYLAIYIACEDNGIFRYALNEEDPDPTKNGDAGFIKTGSGVIVDLVSKFNKGSGVLTPDVEGMSLFRFAEKGYLVVSNQGDDDLDKDPIGRKNNNSTFILYDREFASGQPNVFKKRFRVEKKGTSIDPVEYTDGLTANGSNFNASFPAGLLVVHDKLNGEELPAGSFRPSNFKYISWKEIAETGTPRLFVP
jgi:3-phytase